MQEVFFAIGRFLEVTFDLLLVPVTGLLPYGGLANWCIWGVIGVGLLYWLRTQVAYNRKAKRDNAYI